MPHLPTPLPPRADGEPHAQWLERAWAAADPGDLLAAADEVLAPAAVPNSIEELTALDRATRNEILEAYQWL